MTHNLPGWKQHYSKGCHSIIRDDYYFGSFLNYDKQEDLSVQYWYSKTPKPVSNPDKTVPMILR